MKLERKDIDKEGAGSVTLLPQEEEDMWHIYNLIAEGDHLTAVCFRKVTKEGQTGSVQQTRVKLKLTIDIETIEFDSATCQIRVKGKNLTENEHIKLGQYHTLELELQRSFTLHKQLWDSVYLERVDIACDVRNTADVAALVMQPGLAHLCLITAHMTQIRAKIEVHIPRKRMGSSTGHDKSMMRFFEAMADALMKHVNFKVVKCVIVASPGFTKEDFLKWLWETAVKREWKELLENKGKFLQAHSSAGYKHSLQEVLKDSTVAAKIANTKAFGEVKALDDFYEMFHNDPDRAFYGFNHVRKANEQKAIESLLVSDSLFRSSDVRTRKQYVQLVESAKENGSKVHVFSAMHVSGEQLAQLSGVAAVLRFPLPDIDEGDAAAASDEKGGGVVGAGAGGAAAAAAAAAPAKQPKASLAIEAAQDAGDGLDMLDATPVALSVRQTSTPKPERKD